MVLTLDDAGSPAADAAARDTVPTDATLARTLRRLGFFPSLATPAYRSPAAQRPGDGTDPVAPDWRPL
jgi:hypothetical protein